MLHILNEWMKAGFYLPVRALCFWTLTLTSLNPQCAGWKWKDITILLWSWFMTDRTQIWLLITSLLAKKMLFQILKWKNTSGGGFITITEKFKLSFWMIISSFDITINISVYIRSYVLNVPIWQLKKSLHVPPLADIKICSPHAFLIFQTEMSLGCSVKAGVLPLKYPKCFVMWENECHTLMERLRVKLSESLNNISPKKTVHDSVYEKCETNRVFVSQWVCEFIF